MVILLLCMILGCSEKKVPPPKTMVNLSHLNHLYQDVAMGEKNFAFIHIYSDYPDYKYAWEKHEGIACVDDVARATVVYLDHYLSSGYDSSLIRSKQLVKFLLYMQAENGYFYNFILEDFSINKAYQRSLAKSDWWTWRALWALVKAGPVIKETDPGLAQMIENSIQKSLTPILENKIEKQNYYQIAGFQLPEWLIYQSAADQTAVLVMALCAYEQFSSTNGLPEYVSQLAKGLQQMQAGDLDSYPYGALLSWKNMWHGWGNLQAYALLFASEKLGDQKFRNTAIKEIDGFYSYLMEENYYAELHFSRNENGITSSEIKKFPQIAYIIRPMVYACLKAYDATGNNKYLINAAKHTAWLFGKNPAAKTMYNPHTGRCFDGIQNETKINMNSGAESTIEALLALQMLEKYPLAYEHLWEIIGEIEEL
jgi:hypothetical protein